MPNFKFWGFDDASGFVAGCACQHGRNLLSKSLDPSTGSRLRGATKPLNTKPEAEGGRLRLA